MDAQTMQNPADMTGQAIANALPQAQQPANSSVQAGLKTVGTGAWSPDQVVSGLNRLQQKREGITSEFEKEYAAHPDAPLPESQYHPLPPKEITAFTGLMMVLGALAGRNAMTPMTAAMNNITGILRGHKEKSDEMIAAQKEQFEMNFKAGIEKAKQVADQKEQILKKYNYNLGDADHELNIFKMEHGIGNDIERNNAANTKILNDLNVKLEGMKTALMLGMIKEKPAEQKNRPMITYKDEKGQTVQRFANEQEMAGAPFPTGATAGGAGGRGTYQSAIQQRFNNVIMTNADEMAHDVDKMTKLTNPQARFWVPKSNESLLGAIDRLSSNKMSGDEANSFNTLISGIGKNIISVEQGGRMSSNQAAQAMQERYAIQGGMTQFDAMFKLATMRQDFEVAADNQMASGTLNPAQQDILKKDVDMIRSAVPYTLDDVISAQRGGEQSFKETSSELVLKEGQTSTSKSGKPIVYKNGQWVYQ